MSCYITESGINFIVDNTFHIEKSQLYIAVRDGIRTVEFIRIKDEKLLLFVEAKTTFPNPDNPSVENKENFLKETEEICDKFIHSLSLFSSVIIGVRECVFPSDFILSEKISLKLILVVKNHKHEWCRKLKRKLNAALPSYLKKIWDTEILVINENGAIQYGIAYN